MPRTLRFILTFCCLFTGLGLDQTRVSAQSGTIPSTEPDSGAVVCPPGVYPTTPLDCLALGPSEFLAEGVASGIPYPILSLPSYSPSADLNDSPYLYFRVTDQGVPLFASLQDAIANQPFGALPPGLELFVSYLGGPIKTDQGTNYYQLRSGVWIPGDGSRQGQFTPAFQGLQFSSQPLTSFGWILGDVQTRTAPGLDSSQTGHTLHRFNVVPIYATQLASNLTWELVAPGEWVDSRQVARVDPHTDAPSGVTGPRWIEVNLQEQTLSVYDNARLVFATMTSTGVPHFWTRPGTFQIYEKKPTETMSGSTEPDRSDYYYLQDVPWTMYFDEQRALHGAYWHNRFGYPMSHGCVNLSIGDAHWLYDWANVNDFVYVYDPSGRTPTDPASYGSGAP